MKINWMKRGVRNWLWLDIHTKRWVYVFTCRRWRLPYLYRSIDGTPPCEDNKGKMMFGRYT